MMEDKLFDLVFSGTVLQVNRPADAALGVTFGVDRVWKGATSKRFVLYIWGLDSEMPRFDAGRRYLVAATHLDAQRRRLVGLADGVPLAFRPTGCGGLAYENAEQAGLIRDLGPGQPPGQPAADFGFHFEFKRCQTNTLDTDGNTYTRELGLGEPSVSIPLTLTREQMRAVYDEVLNIGFFDYPTLFWGGVVSTTGEASYVHPSTSYRLDVRNAGIVHTVSWDDRSRPRSEEANRLLKLFDIINGFVNDRPEVKNLPVSRGGCE
jgi:hypothetical protein